MFCIFAMHTASPVINKILSRFPLVSNLFAFPCSYPQFGDDDACSANARKLRICALNSIKTLKALI